MLTRLSLHTRMWDVELKSWLTSQSNLCSEPGLFAILLRHVSVCVFARLILSIGICDMEFKS